MFHSCVPPQKIKSSFIFLSWNVFQDSFMSITCFFMKKMNNDQCVITLVVRYLTSVENMGKKEEDIRQGQREFFFGCGSNYWEEGWEKFGGKVTFITMSMQNIYFSLSPKVLRCLGCHILLQSMCSLFPLLVREVGSPFFLI